MIGIDIIEVKRIKKALKQQSFIERVFTQNEIEYAKKFKNFEAHLAGFFAAKEAVMKALQDCKQISFLNIEVFHAQNGSPYVKLYGKAKTVFEGLNCNKIEISISQTITIATAICIIS